MAYLFYTVGLCLVYVVLCQGHPAPANGTKCYPCGNFAQNIPCTLTELVTAQPQSCPEALPYCYSAFWKSGSQTRAYKGCAEINFCRLEWYASGSKPECQNPDFNAAGPLSCAYCCKGDKCNQNLVPDHAAQVTFP